MRVVRPGGRVVVADPDYGTVMADHAAAWIRDLEQRAAAGRFFSAITVLLVSGRNPDDPLRDTLDVLVGTHSIVAPVSAQSD